MRVVLFEKKWNNKINDIFYHPFYATKRKPLIFVHQCKPVACYKFAADLGLFTRFKSILHVCKLY